MSTAVDFDPDETGAASSASTATVRARPGPKPGTPRKLLDPDEEYAGPTDNGRLRPCAVVGCRGHGTHWRRDDRRAVAESVLVCIDHRAAGELPPIPPPVLDEVGARLEALVRDAGESVVPADAAKRLGIPLTEVYRIARARGLPLVSGRLRPPPPKATGPVALPKPKHEPSAPARAREGRPRKKPAPPVRSSPTKHTPTAERRGTPDPGNPPGPVSVASGPVEPAPEAVPELRVPALKRRPDLADVCRRSDEMAEAVGLGPAKVTKRDPPPSRVGRDVRAEGATYRERLLACFPDDAWRRPADVIRSLRGPGQGLRAAQIQFRNHARPLVKEGVLEIAGAEAYVDSAEGMVDQALAKHADANGIKVGTPTAVGEA